jgi:predicted RNase H-like HicB family nuclease
MATYLEYLRAAMNRAQYEQMEDGEWYAHIPEFKGLWATGGTRHAATQELYAALDAWLHVNFHIAKLELPRLDGISPLDLPQRVEE